jgi:hypothetical protein
MSELAFTPVELTDTPFAKLRSLGGVAKSVNKPERINGLPACLVVMQASSGKAVSSLTWKEGRRSYDLWMDANVTVGQLRPQLFALAASLPASVPAQLH